jgi:hypothetical protein
MIKFFGNKKLLMIGLTALCALLLPSAASADFGPKPSITITAKNMPDTPCYMDLLVNYPAEGTMPNIVDESEYDPGMLKILKEYNKNGWRAAMVTGTMPPLIGDIRCRLTEGASTNTFSYMGVPDFFKIIVVSSDGNVVVSNEIRRKAFKSSVTFDYSAGRAKENPIIFAYLFQFLVTCAATLIIEGIFLRIFRFSLKQNWRPFLLINLITQVLLTLIIFTSAYFEGPMAAITWYAAFEAAVLVIEAVLFAVCLKQHSILRRVLFALSANLSGLFIGLLAVFPA